MHLLTKLTEWNAARQKVREMEMEQQGKCPDCSGRGIEMFPEKYLYSSHYICPGCNGSGLFEDWKK
ncbi:hypothetical protein [Virgibacillus senegalensis]|uniref:hypothetical protein n=1 Tax=Virgibacillus senegalensis TaxID=1499679 RepID=UPI00069DB0F7|nr:hypothetical protein [Virgibacillus senegalensis]